MLRLALDPVVDLERRVLQGVGDRRAQLGRGRVGLQAESQALEGVGDEQALLEEA